MAYSLTSSEISHLVGSQAFTRGADYAATGRVGPVERFGSGTQLVASVRGNRATPYLVTVSFRVDKAGHVLRASGVCGCPMRANCKHVAALLIATQPGSPAPTHEHWRQVLQPLARVSAPEGSGGTAMGIQFDLQAPGREGGPRLGARPVALGANGKWLVGTLSWYGLIYSSGPYNSTHLGILKAINALSQSARGYHVYDDKWLPLDTVAGRTLWDLLAEATVAGMGLVTSGRQQDPVNLSSEPGRLDLDLTRGSEGLDITPTLTLADRVLQHGSYGFVGTPAHGVYTWEGEVGTASGSLLLAPLSSPVGAELRALALAETSIHVPDIEVDSFLTDVYPFLRQQHPLTSHDGSFAPPAMPRPVLALSISPGGGARIELEWEWHYHPQDLPAEELATTPPDHRHGLRPAAGDTGYRDMEAEAEVLASIAAIIGAHPALSRRGMGGQQLADRTALSDLAMIEFIGTAVPELIATGNVNVTFTSDTPDYRPATEAPLISLATTERPGSRDWFDLAVTVTIDGEEIPFDGLFRALALAQEIMILPSGTYFTLDRPELHQLRHLIEEARGLQESRSGTLGISRFQSDLWAELELLGVASEQAAAWRETVAGLTGTGRIPEREVPSAVNATLRGYQQTGFEWLAYLYDLGLGGILADDMGLGKTLQAIALICHAREQGSTVPFLVVAPTSVVPNWAAECARFAPDLVVATVTETEKRRETGIAAIAAGADVVITSYTLFRLEFDEYEEQEWAGLLLDEAQFVKNHRALAHQCVRRLSTPFKLAITGTPMENNLMELWSLVSITAPGLFPSPTWFAEYYQKPIERMSDADKLAQLRRRISPFMLRRTKEEVAGDLPPKQEQVLELELHPRHRKVYQTHLQRERQKVLGLISDMNANRFEIFRSLTMLRQLSLDASLYDEKYAAIPSTKLDALGELLDDIVAEGHRVLIFSQFTKYLAKARTRLDAAGISYSYLDGRTRNRAKVITDFKEGATSVFLISLKAGGFGLNLAEADYCILLDPWWNPATEAQAVDRAHRIGQARTVMVYRLVSKDTIEEKVMALKAAKAKLFDSVLADGAAGGAGITARDIRELLS